jgi:hypothetical protein
MGDDLRDVLLLLYDAGAENVPAHAIAWRADMTPAINVGMNMGYMRYRERGGVRHFYLTEAGYSKIGIPPYSPWASMRSWIKRLVSRDTKH